MRNGQERAWDADEAYRALHPQEGEEASQQPTSSILEAVIAAALAIIVLLFMVGLIAIGAVWWLDGSDCGDLATWSCAL